MAQLTLDYVKFSLLNMRDLRLASNQTNVALMKKLYPPLIFSFLLKLQLFTLLLSIYLSFNLIIYLSHYLSIALSIYLIIYLSHYLSISQLICLSPSICLFLIIYLQSAFLCFCLFLNYAQVFSLLSLYLSFCIYNFLL